MPDAEAGALGVMRRRAIDAPHHQQWENQSIVDSTRRRDLIGELKNGIESVVHGTVPPPSSKTKMYSGLLVIASAVELSW